MENNPESLPKIPYSKTNEKEQDEKLMEPFAYILQVPGKNIRAKLARAFNYWLEISEDKLSQISDIVQILHNSSLLLDDIQDNSILRRGIPVAHAIYGVPSTINSANYTSFIALERVLPLNHPDAISITIEQILELYRGQGMEIYWRDNFMCPSEEDYRQMVIRKTGGLFMLAIRLMQLFSQSKEDFSKITAILGLYFQIRDDYINLISQDYMQHKSYCEDLTEGKFSFPVIHAIKTHPEDKQIMRNKHVPIFLSFDKVVNSCFGNTLADDNWNEAILDFKDNLDELKIPYTPKIHALIHYVAEFIK